VPLLAGDGQHIGSAGLDGALDIAVKHRRLQMIHGLESALTISLKWKAYGVWPMPTALAVVM
jgi:hypothetical protein